MKISDENKPYYARYFFIYMAMFAFLGVCFVSIILSTNKHYQDQSVIKRNNELIPSLSIGMTTDEVVELLGYPIYAKSFEDGNVWLYQTYKPIGKEKDIIKAKKNTYTFMYFDRENKLISIGGKDEK